ncbi:hypothetical protein ACIRYZ_14505 [Kitasatospora sp. NPDC101155]|uniref:hypothetical protein n=1 Tax=Kitasatospora sp. NPDC101155 TaxID=3364097 RepID=UPI0038238B1D
MGRFKAADLANLLEDANRTESDEILEAVHGDRFVDTRTPRQRLDLALRVRSRDPGTVREGYDHARHGRADSLAADFVPGGVVDLFCLLGRECARVYLPQNTVLTSLCISFWYASSGASTAST